MVFSKINKDANFIGLFSNTISDDTATLSG
jgi:hypothetical protein